MLECSNRTFMELKSGLIRRTESPPESSNRTFMELKLHSSLIRC